MTTISSKTPEKIKGFLEGFIQGLVEEYQGRVIQKPTTARDYLSLKSTKAELKPFHAAIIPPEVIRINQFEPGFSTRLGTSLEECARLVALEHHQDAQRAYDIQAEVSKIDWE
ncbi:MAG: TdeIII family type II restriction endonuclease [Microcoleaceae cyanobacterium MO_207.B10]|nr:TdeIII family type II restriction endonuclease [Microcoleaceae cyanobacterium MO_207.B10]